MSFLNEAENAVRSDVDQTQYAQACALIAIAQQLQTLNAQVESLAKAVRVNGVPVEIVSGGAINPLP